MANNRLEKILDLLNENEYLTYNDLSKELNAATITVRRDVDVLEKEGKIIKIKGGSIIINDYRKYKNETDYLRKKTICKFAADFINNGDSLIIDIGTTTKQIVPFLRNKKNLTIFTQSLEIAHEIYLLDNNSINVISVGGLLDYKLGVFFSEQSSKAMSEYSFDKGFLSCSGITIEEGVTNFTLPIYIHKNIILNNSRECYFLIDSSKFRKVSLAKVCSIEKVKNIITDSNIDKKVALEFKKIVPNFYIANS